MREYKEVYWFYDLQKLKYMHITTTKNFKGEAQ